MRTLTFALILLYLILSFFGCAEPTPPPSPPNIVFILADDLGIGDPQIYNPASAIPTPNMDRLGNAGMRFHDMHTPSAVCTPTRYGILTGRYAWRSRLKSGVLVGQDPPLIEPEQSTIAEMLQAQSYHTAVIGKWHLGLGWQKKREKDPIAYGAPWSVDSLNIDFSLPLTDSPNDHGFSYSYIIPSSLDIQPYCYIEDHKVLGLPMAFTAGVAQDTAGRGVFWRYGEVASNFSFTDVLDHLGEKAVQYLEERSESSQPFFLYLPLSAPHTPWLPGKAYEGNSQAGTYGDFVSHVDDILGKVLNQLDSTGLAQNTILVFTSDNGAHWTPNDKSRFAHRANGKLRGQKADIWEAGHRVPFFIRWPGQIAPKSENHTTVCLTDFMVTVQQIVGANLPPDAAEDSYDLSPLLRGESLAPARPPVVHHSAQGHFAIRDGDWKLILRPGSGGFSAPRAPEGEEGQLYQLQRDPQEQSNLYADYPDKVTELSQKLAEIRGQVPTKPPTP
ncbi:MAG: arylsulfatase [Bacteroidota bacterium]